MPKRNSTESVLINLATDSDAESQKANQLATIPDPIWEPAIPFTIGVASRKFNVRDDASYKYENNKHLFRSLKEKGLEKRGDPMAFHVEPDGSYLVMVGNLRFTMMSDIRKLEIDRRVAEGLDASPETLPFATIFGLVYRGLTIGQKTAIMADHLGRKNLNEFEKCKEIGDFIDANGLTDAQAVVHFGMEKNKIRRYRMRNAMPTVMAEFRKEKSGGDEPYITVGQLALEAMYSALRDDMDGGNARGVEGPAFRAAWATFLANPNMYSDAKNAKKNKGPAARDRSVLVNQVTITEAGYDDTPEMIAIADALRFAAGDEVNLNTVRDSLRDYTESLRADNETLRAEIETLRTDFAKAREMLASLNTDYDSLLAETQELRAKVKPTRKPSVK